MAIDIQNAVYNQDNSYWGTANGQYFDWRPGQTWYNTVNPAYPDFNTNPDAFIESIGEAGITYKQPTDSAGNIIPRTIMGTDAEMLQAINNYYGSGGFQYQPYTLAGPDWGTQIQNSAYDAVSKAAEQVGEVAGTVIPSVLKVVPTAMASYVGGPVAGAAVSALQDMAVNSTKGEDQNLGTTLGKAIISAIASYRASGLGDYISSLGDYISSLGDVGTIAGSELEAASQINPTEYFSVNEGLSLESPNFYSGTDLTGGSSPSFDGNYQYTSPTDYFSVDQGLQLPNLGGSDFYSNIPTEAPGYSEAPKTYFGENSALGNLSTGNFYDNLGQDKVEYFTPREDLQTDVIAAPKGSGGNDLTNILRQLQKATGNLGNTGTVNIQSSAAPLLDSNMLTTFLQNQNDYQKPSNLSAGMQNASDIANMNTFLNKMAQVSGPQYYEYQGGI